jgi:hypothetical protein
MSLPTDLKSFNSLHLSAIGCTDKKLRLRGIRNLSFKDIRKEIPRIQMENTHRKQSVHVTARRQKTA